MATSQIKHVLGLDIIRKSDRNLIGTGLVTNYGEGGQQNGSGGHVKFYPYEKRGGGGSFSHAEGGYKKFPLFKKGGGAKSFTLS